MDERDEELMRLAVAEAAKCVPEPGGARPRVGVVVARAGELLCSAYRGEITAGQHAEYTALEGKLSASTLAGATLYTTLEPCTTRQHPKVPCAERIIQRKIGRVLIGILDPNPLISGRGFRRLRQANIPTELFSAPFMAQVEELNREFMSHYPLSAAAPRSQELATSVPTISTAAPDGPFVLAGSGQQASELFTLEKGLNVFKLSHDGRAHFAVWLLDNEGGRLELLASETGLFSGSKAVQIVRSGQYILNIDADGAWLLSVVGAGPVRALSLAELPRFQGSVVIYSRSERTYGIYNTGADIYNLSLQPVPGVTMSLSHVASLGRHQMLQIKLEAPGGLAPALTVSLRYVTTSGRPSVQLFYLPQDQSPARPIP